MEIEKNAGFGTGILNIIATEIISLLGFEINKKTPFNKLYIKY